MYLGQNNKDDYVVTVSVPANKVGQLNVVEAFKKHAIGSDQIVSMSELEAKIRNVTAGQWQKLRADGFGVGGPVGLK